MVRGCLIFSKKEKFLIRYGSLLIAFFTQNGIFWSEGMYGTVRCAKKIRIKTDFLLYTFLILVGLWISSLNLSMKCLRVIFRSGRRFFSYEIVYLFHNFKDPSVRMVVWFSFLYNQKSLSIFSILTLSYALNIFAFQTSP